MLRGGRARGTRLWGACGEGDSTLSAASLHHPPLDRRCSLCYLLLATYLQGIVHAVYVIIKKPKSGSA